MERTLKTKLSERPQGSLKPGAKQVAQLGFDLMDYTEALKKGLESELGLPSLTKSRPVVTKIINGSAAHQAGLYPGDIILDINQRPVYKANTAIKYLKKPQAYILRILRRNQVELIYLPKP